MLIIVNGSLVPKDVVYTGEEDVLPTQDSHKDGHNGFACDCPESELGGDAEANEEKDELAVVLSQSLLFVDKIVVLVQLEPYRTVFFKFVAGGILEQTGVFVRNFG